ncbi:hypothetical protein ACFO4U_10895 [Exiguobacterium profundum]|uniref:hypothetical protein n=1 Tax=Exiguobacterium TaxID=33986 RepID=UPI001BFC80DD|nr:MULTISPECIES: hypothetical protein [Exiguobacterium]MCT4798749.1 hypothetical protein [Exiguobacterium profundum]
MNRNIVNLSILALLMAVMVMNNLEGLHMLKTIVNSLAMLTLSVIGIMFITNYAKNKKQAM